MTAGDAIGIAIRFVCSYFVLLLFATSAWLYYRYQRLEIRSGAQSNLLSSDGIEMSVRPSGGKSSDSAPMKQIGFAEHAVGSIVRWSYVGLALLIHIMLGFLNIVLYITDDEDAVFLPFACFFFISAPMFLGASLLPSIRKWFLMSSALNVATHVLVTEEDHEPDNGDPIVQNKNTPTTSSKEFMLEVRWDATQRWFTHMCVRYVWNEADGCFTPVGRLKVYFDEISTKGIAAADAEKIYSECPNVIDVGVPSVLESLIEEFSSTIYVFQIYSFWLAIVWITWNEAIIFALMTLSSGVVRSLRIVRPQQLRIRDMALFDEPVRVLRDGVWQDISSTKLVPGDILRPREGIIPCDCILLKGVAVTNEAMLTGEPMPVQKFAVEPRDEHVQIDRQRHKKHVLLAGTSLLQCHDCICVATATGAMTAKGELVRMVLFPSNQRFKSMDQLPRVFAVFGLYGLVLMFCLVGKDVGLPGLFAGTFCVLQTLNPLLPVSLSAGQSMGASRLGEKGIKCLAPPRLTIAGKLHAIVFDKTGTLTENGMDLVGVVPSSLDTDSQTLEPMISFQSCESRMPFLEGHGNLWNVALATCHTVARVGGKLVGPDVEVRMLERSGWSLEAEDDGQRRKFEGLDGETATVLRALEFDHDRMTSGVLVEFGSRTSLSPSTKLFVKGSYEKIAALCPVANAVMEEILSYAKQNFYVLGVALREVPDTLVDTLVNAPRSDLDGEESGLRFLGLLLFRNELKKESAKVLHDLRAGGVRCVMCTGDNVYTAVAIAQACGLVSGVVSVLIGDMEDGNLVWRKEDGNPINETDASFHLESAELVVTGAAYAYIVRHDLHKSRNCDFFLRVRIFGRMLPDQKMDLVKRLQALGLIVGMCGDGGNDCAALRAAHVGIALSEAEASIVAPFSSGKDKSPVSVVEVAKMGRACLATNLAAYNFFILNGLALTFWKVAQSLIASVWAAEWQFLWVDIVSTLAFTWAMTFSMHESEVLAPERPKSSLFGPTIVFGLCVPHLFFIITCFFIWIVLFNTQGDWYMGYTHEFVLQVRKPMLLLQDGDKPQRGHPPYALGDNYATASVFPTLVAHVATMAMTYSFGGLFRRSIFRAVTLLSVVLGTYGFALALVLSPPSTFSCIFRINCSNEVASAMYVPFLTEFSVMQLGTCFYGPQGDIWLQPSRHGHDGVAPYHMNEGTEPKCVPPQNSSLPAENPNNVFPDHWKTFLIATTAGLCIADVLFMTFGLKPLADWLGRNSGHKYSV